MVTATSTGDFISNKSDIEIRITAQGFIKFIIACIVKYIIELL